MTATPVSKIPAAPQISEDEFDEIYQPETNQITHEETNRYDTDGPELAYVQRIMQTAPNTVWTLLEVDGQLYIDAGFHTVNRIGYIITAKAWDNPHMSIPCDNVDEDTRAPESYFASATYSPEDNKIRLYTTERLPDEIYQTVKALKFKYAPMQKLFFARWTVMREDFALKMCGEIEAEEMTLAERAEAKIERLNGYAQNRAKDASIFERAARDYSAGFANGQPILQGHHSQRKMENDLKRAKSATKKAIQSHETAKYHLYKADGVAAFAERKNNPLVRAGRIKTLFADLRRYQREQADSETYLKWWKAAQTDEEIDRLTNSYKTARQGDYQNVQDGSLTRETCRLENIDRFERSINHRGRKRVIEHILSRLSYEYSYLPETPKFDGELTPVILQAFARQHGADKPKARKSETGFILESPVKLPAHLSPEASLDLSAEAWRELMQACKYTVEIKARRKTTSTKAKIPLLNPSEQDAQKIQEIWNLQMKLSCLKNKCTPKIAEAKPATQKGYSSRAKGSYATCQAVEVDKHLRRIDRRYYGEERKDTRTPLARLRIYTGGSEFYKASEIIFIKDKPSHELPFNFDDIIQDLNIAILDLEAPKEPS